MQGHRFVQTDRSITSSSCSTSSSSSSSSLSSSCTFFTASDEDSDSTSDDDSRYFDSRTPSETNSSVGDSDGENEKKKNKRVEKSPKKKVPRKQADIFKRYDADDPRYYDGCEDEGKTSSPSKQKRKNDTTAAAPLSKRQQKALEKEQKRLAAIETALVNLERNRSDSTLLSQGGAIIDVLTLVFDYATTRDLLKHIVFVCKDFSVLVGVAGRYIWKQRWQATIATWANVFVGLGQGEEKGVEGVGPNVGYEMVASPGQYMSLRFVTTQPSLVLHPLRLGAPTSAQRQRQADLRRLEDAKSVTSSSSPAFEMEKASGCEETLFRKHLTSIFTRLAEIPTTSSTLATAEKVLEESRRAERDRAQQNAASSSSPSSEETLWGRMRAQREEEERRLQEEEDAAGKIAVQEQRLKRALFYFDDDLHGEPRCDPAPSIQPPGGGSGTTESSPCATATATATAQHSISQQEWFTKFRTRFRCTYFSDDGSRSSTDFIRNAALTLFCAEYRQAIQEVFAPTQLTSYRAPFLNISAPLTYAFGLLFPVFLDDERGDDSATAFEEWPTFEKEQFSDISSIEDALQGETKKCPEKGDILSAQQHLSRSSTPPPSSAIPSGSITPQQQVDITTNSNDGAAPQVDDELDTTTGTSSATVGIHVVAPAASVEATTTAAAHNQVNAKLRPLFSMKHILLYQFLLTHTYVTDVNQHCFRENEEKFACCSRIVSPSGATVELRLFLSCLGGSFPRVYAKCLFCPSSFPHDIMPENFEGNPYMKTDLFVGGFGRVEVDIVPKAFKDGFVEVRRLLELPEDFPMQLLWNAIIFGSCAFLRLSRHTSSFLFNYRRTFAQAFEDAMDFPAERRVYPQGN